MYRIGGSSIIFFLTYLTYRRRSSLGPFLSDGLGPLAIDFVPEFCEGPSVISDSSLILTLCLVNPLLSWLVDKGLRLKMNKMSM